MGIKKIVMAAAGTLLFFIMMARPAISSENLDSDKTSGQVVFQSVLHDVNYDLSVDSAIEMGLYNYHEEIPHYFLSKYTGIQTTGFSLVQFDQGVTFDEVLKDLARKNLSPAELTELLAFGAQYPGLQLYFDIIALDSVFEETMVNLNTGESFQRKYIFCLDGEKVHNSYDEYRNAERFISRISYGEVHDPYYGHELFLAVPAAVRRILEKRK